MQNRRSEELIRRYLEGEMSVAEEHDFLIDVAVDRELRLELSAQQTIDRALVKDRPTIDPEQYGLLQQSVAGLIGTIPARRSLPSSRIGMALGALFLFTGFSLFLLWDNSNPTKSVPEATQPSLTSGVEGGSEVEAKVDGLIDRDRSEAPGTISGTAVDRSGSSGRSRRTDARVPRPIGLEELPAGIGPTFSTPPVASPAATIVDTGKVDRERAPKASDSIDLDLRVEWDLPE